MRIKFVPTFKKIILPFVFFIFLILNTILLFLPNLYFKLRKKYILVFNGLGVGDALSFTSAINHLNKKEKANFIVASFYSDVFYNLNGVVKNIQIKDNFLIKIIFYFLESSTHSNIISCYGGNLYYKRFSFLYKTEYSYYGEVLRNNRLYLMHVFLFARKDFLKKVKNIKLNPIISFTTEEIEQYSKKYKDILKVKYSIVTSGTYSIIRSKNLDYSKINNILQNTYKKTKWVQTGTKKDRRLKNMFLDLRGKTSLRELFFLISKSKFVFTNEGVATHISAAFNIPCISIYTGYHYPKISLYANVIPIVPDPLPNCAYCFRKVCPYSKHVNMGKCANNIKVSKILNEIKKIS